MRVRLGLKAWTTNLPLIPQVEQAFSEGNLDYVELFCIPETVSDTAPKWAQIGIPFIVHAPHSVSGLNPANAEWVNQNGRLAAEAYRLADALRAPYVIFHPGLGGLLDESLHQLSRIFDPRMVVENKPYRGLDGSICVGSTPAEMKLITERLETPFCLDFGHAIASSRSRGEDPLRFIEEFLALYPKMYHLTDGDYSSEYDHHGPYGTGTFPLMDLLAMVPDGSWVTDEARRHDSNSLAEYLIDRQWLVAHE